MARLFRRREEVVKRLFHQRMLPFTAAAKRALQGAAEEAQRLQHGYIGTEHLLLGLLRVEDDVTARVAHRLGGGAGQGTERRRGHRQARRRTSLRALRPPRPPPHCTPRRA